MFKSQTLKLNIFAFSNDQKYPEIVTYLNIISKSQTQWFPNFISKNVFPFCLVTWDLSAVKVKNALQVARVLLSWGSSKR